MLEYFRSTKIYKVTGYVAYPVALILFLLHKYVMIGMGVLLGMIPLTCIYIGYGLFFLQSVIQANNDQKNIKQLNPNLLADIGFILGAIVLGIFVCGVLGFFGFMILSTGN